MDHDEGHDDHHLEHDEGDDDHHELPDEEIPHALNTRCSNRCNLTIETYDAGVSIIHIDIHIQDDTLIKVLPIHINVC